PRPVLAIRLLVLECGGSPPLYAVSHSPHTHNDSLRPYTRVHLRRAGSQTPSLRLGTEHRLERAGLPPLLLWPKPKSHQRRPIWFPRAKPALTRHIDAPTLLPYSAD